MPYLGNEPATVYTSTTKDTFSGDASTTDFTMSKAANVNAVRVVVENVVQNPTVAYTCSGTTLSFTSAPPTGTSNIYVVHLGPPAATVAPPTTINNATTFTAGIVLDNEDSTLSGGEVLGKIEFKDNDGGSAAAGVTSKIESLAVGDFGASALTLSTSSSSGGARTALTERMRVDNKGNVGIGTDTIDVSTQAGGSGYKALQIESDEGGQLNFDHNDAGTGSTLGQINFQRAGEVVAEIEGVTDGATDSGRIAFRTQAASGALTERMRITSAGEVDIGTITHSGDNMLQIASPNLSATRGGISVQNKTDNSGGYFVAFYRSSSALIGSISQSAQNAVAYNTSSDYRLKENVSYDFDATTRLKQLKPCIFNWIDDEDNTPVDGFLAHEVSSVVPEAITGTKDEVDDNGDAVMQGIDQSKLVPLLTAALQEAIAKIETLETKVAALEAE